MGLSKIRAYYKQIETSYKEQSHILFILSIYQSNQKGILKKEYLKMIFGRISINSLNFTCSSLEKKSCFFRS